MTTIAKGRTAQTKGVSMLPDEIADARLVESLTGLGFSEVYHRHFAPQMRAAAQILQEVQESGVELNRSLLKDHWDLDMSQSKLTCLYAAKSELTVGD